MFSKTKKMDVFTSCVVRVFTACVICCYLSTADPDMTSETKALMYSQKYGYRKETGSSPSSHAMKDFQRIIGLAESGRPKRAVPEPPESESLVNLYESDVPDICHDSSIDAATVTVDGRTYFFKGNYYWQIEYPRIFSPRKISDDWPGLPGNLDAAVTWTSGVTYFFKKNQYWRFYNNIAFSGYPKNISDGFLGIPNDIDAVFVWNDGHTYFFKGAIYWRYDEKSQPPVSSQYPQPISNWKGLPTDIDAALQWTNRRAYVFKGSKYYRIHGTTPSVDEANPPYPLSTSVLWFDCPPDLCQDSSIDAATRTEDGQTYVFKGQYYWKIGATGISDGYPRKISYFWPGLPGDLDAALTWWANNKTYFFKKNQYWRFHNKRMDSGYPKNISDGFRGIPNDIDAAFVWNLNGKFYFFKGDKYWKYDPENKPFVSDYYPQPISIWQGVPDNIDAAFQWNLNTYFFKGSQYYRFDDMLFSVSVSATAVGPSYPRSSYLWWFDCEKVNKLKGNQRQ